MSKQLVLVGLNHKTAGVEIRERFALSECPGPGEAPAGLGWGFMPVGDAIKEAMVLSTCNRVEITAVGERDDTEQRIIKHWAEFSKRSPEDLAPYVYALHDLDAARHVFTVASSLDSMVVGEPQILGQLKDSYRESVQQGTTGPIINRLLHKAFSVAKRVRTETAIGSSAVSISYAAVELAKRIFGDMRDYTAMLVGAGEMAELAATHLLRAGVQKFLVANRTFARAQELAEHFNGEPVFFEDMFSRLAEVDIIISSTGSPTAVIRAKDVRGVLRKRRNKPMFFIDIAVPRDIDPDVNSLDNVYLYDIDDLKEVVEENMEKRQEEASRARAIVECEVQAFGKWLKSLELTPTIVDLLQHGDDIAAKEAAKTLKRLGPDLAPESREAVETLAASLVKKLYHDPITFLKRRAEEEDASQRYIELTRRMFDLDGDAELSPGHPSRRRPTKDYIDGDPHDYEE